MFWTKETSIADEFKTSLELMLQEGNQSSLDIHNKSTCKQRVGALASGKSNTAKPTSERVINILHSQATFKV